LLAVLPKRWVVERTIAWLNRRRRLAKDWENLNRNAPAFLRLASIRLILRKLCNPRLMFPDRLRGAPVHPSLGYRAGWP
jgi:Transposase DDE domain